MIKVALVRGAYLNNFEAQNYIFNPRNIEITGFSSLHSIHTRFPFSVVKLPSFHDLSSVTSSAIWNKGVYYIANRLIGDSQVLYGLEKYADQYDIFHTADAHYYYSYQLARMRQQNKIKKLLVTSWETIPFNNESVSRKKENKYFVYRYADQFLCYSQKAKSCLIREGVNKHKITIIPLGVDLNKFHAAKLNKSNKSLTILFVGRLVAEKGIMELYQAYKKINNTIKLRVIGNGPLYKQLHDQITIERKNYEQMAEVYRQADIFIMPSKKTATWEEQYGMVLIEAMASGLPVIAYNTGSIAELLDNAGMLIPPNSQRLYKSIHTLINNETLRRSLGIKARQRVQKYFDSQKTARQIEKLYRQMIKN